MGSFLQVTAPLAVIRDESGAQHYFYEGAVLPAGLDGDHVKHLLDAGVVSQADVPDEDDAKGKRAPARKSD